MGDIDKFIDGKEKSYMKETTSRDLYAYLNKEYPTVARKVGEISQAMEWDIMGAYSFVIHLLEDVNAHSANKQIEKILLKDLKKFESKQVNEHINIGRDKFRINMDALKLHNDNEGYLTAVKNELMKGNGLVQVQCLKPNGMATIYGADSVNVNKYMNDISKYAFSIEVPVDVLVKVDMLNEI